MNQVAVMFGSLVLYRYSLVLALAGAAGVCFFLACCSHAGISSRRAASAALTAVLLSLLLGRLVYWYGRPDSFTSLTQALTSPATESYALAGAFAGCSMTALLLGGQEGRKKMMDCMSVAGCPAIALGRLGCFFTNTNRGQIMTRLTSLPWACPVANASGQPEYRFATFLFQAVAAALLAVVLAVLFSRKKCPGEVSVLFVLAYSASQVLLDSTRYDSLYLRCNGFISLVQVLAAAALALVLVYLSVRAVKTLGRKSWMIPLWVSLTALFCGSMYMEYYVQRHGREAAFAYSVMGICLTCLVFLGVVLWQLSLPREKE